MCLFKSISLETARADKIMDKIFIIFFLGLLSVVYTVAGNVVYNNIGMLEELEGFEIDEESEVELFYTPSWTSERGSKVLVNVDSFGAIGDGISDDTQVHIYSLK